MMYSLTLDFIPYVLVTDESGNLMSDWVMDEKGEDSRM